MRMPQRPGCVVCWVELLNVTGINLIWRAVFAEFGNRLVDVLSEVFAFCYDGCNELS